VSEVLQAGLVVGVDTQPGHAHRGDLRRPRPGRLATAGTRHHGGVRAAAGLGPVSRRGPPRGLGR
jgi:hypothetical protein